jgi:hypothetical protein
MMPRWLWLVLHPFQWYRGAKYRRTHGLRSFSPATLDAVKARRKARR